MPSITDTNAAETQGRQLDSPPPRPPQSRQSQSVMDLAQGDEEMGLGMEAQNPVVQIMMSMGAVKNSLTLLSTQLPLLAPGIQQFIMGLEQAIPQLLADLMSGQAPGMGAPASPLSNTAPSTPSQTQPAAGLP